MSNKIKFFLGALALAMFVAAGSASAQTYTFSGTLKHGSRGASVWNLQKFLNLCPATQVSVSGAGAPGMETQTFGPATKAAVIRFQVSNGLVADGIFGPMSAAKAVALQVSGNPCGSSVVTPPTGLPAGCLSTSGYSPVTGQPCSSALPSGCSSTSGYSSTTGQPCSGGSNPSNPSAGLSGTAGTITDLNELTQYSNEEVSEGQSDVKIAGFEVEASNEGDIELVSMKISFDPSGNTGSDNLDDYLESVSIWQGSTKVAEVDVDDFDQDSSDVYNRTVTLSNSVVRSEDVETFYVSVDAVNNIDSGDISGDSWTFDLENIRFRDGSGVVDTDSSTGDMPGLDVGFNFVTFSSAADTELKISEDSDNPEAGLVVIDEDNGEDDVVLLKGEIEVEGDSDVTIDEFPVTFSPTGSNMNAIVNSVRLIIDGEEYSEAVPSIAAAASATLTFDDLDLTIDAGDTVSFSIVVDVNGTDDLAEGDTLTASVTATNNDYIDAENSQGDQLADDTEKSGTATGEAQTFRATGIDLAFVSVDESTSAGSSNDDDTATFTIKYRVTAVGDDVYVSSLTTSTGMVYTVDRSGTSTTGGVSAVLVNNTDDDLTAVGNYLIEEGETESFTLTVSVAPGQDGLYRASLTTLKWDTDDDATPDNSYTSNMDEFKTDYVSLN